MYKVYGYINFKLVCLGTTFNEGKVLEIIDSFYDKDETCHFIIVKQLKDMMIPYRAILSDLEYEEYKQDYYSRIEKEKTTFQLRKEMLQ
jgi:hypothetical protein